MKKRIFIFASLIAIALLLPYNTKANPLECESASQSLRETQSDLNDALKSYANCLANSNGYEVCASEFSHLSSAQNNFKTAVSDYKSNCKPDEDTIRPMR